MNVGVGDTWRLYCRLGIFERDAYQWRDESGQIVPFGTPKNNQLERLACQIIRDIKAAHPLNS